MVLFMNGQDYNYSYKTQPFENQAYITSYVKHIFSHETV